MPDMPAARDAGKALTRWVLVCGEQTQCRHYASIYFTEEHAKGAAEWSDRNCGQHVGSPHRVVEMVLAETVRGLAAALKCAEDGLAYAEDAGYRVWEGRKQKIADALASVPASLRTEDA